METSPSSGISILISGGGLAGLACAIESHRKGHKVRVLEGRPDFNEHGGMINIGSSALHTPEKWPGFLEQARKHCYKPTSQFYRYNGDFMGEFPLGEPGYPSLPNTRGVLQRDLYAYATQLGIPVEFGVRVVQYRETHDKGSVVTSDGREIEADLVIAADGVGSKSWSLVTGLNDPPASSGYAIYRATIPLAAALENPIIAKEFQGSKTRISLHLGPDVHVVIGKTETDVSWYITFKTDPSKDQGATVPVDEAVKHIQGWAPFLTELVNSTPDKVALIWRILWRNPQSQWYSPNCRVLQIGDAAHAFLPTSNSGATMAWEDAFSIAACLDISGKSNIPQAVKVHTLLRFERTACAQKTGFKNRERWHKKEWDMAEDQSDIGRIVGKWIFKHDAEQYVYENYEKAAESLTNGTPFKNTNSVPGYTYEPWDIIQLTEASQRGETIEDEGDWS
ncbi:hypothetical protein BFW01_g471 [Lasiodiplodia theobromae]|nr:hypothetical protein BFW01_g471 [Lasiodiplodia theobromae]